MDWLILFGGLVVLLLGGEALVRGATSLSRSFGVSALVIGIACLGEHHADADALRADAANALQESLAVEQPVVIG